MDDDFDDLLDLIGDDKKPQQKTNPDVSASKPIPQSVSFKEESSDSDNLKKGESQETKSASFEESQPHPQPKVSNFGGKRKTFKAEKEIDWGDDNPTDLLPDESTTNAKSASSGKGSAGFSMENLLGFEDNSANNSDISSVKRPPTGERRPDPKVSLKPTLKVTDEDDNESLAGRGYQPSLGGGSSRGRRGPTGQSTQGSVKFGGESLIEGGSLVSGNKGTGKLGPSSKDFDAMSDILGLSSEPKATGISSWLEEENQNVPSNDWMNLAKTRRASTGMGPERPKTTSALPTGTSTPKPTESGSLELRPKTSNEPLFGDEIPLDQLFSSKPPPAVKNVAAVKEPVTPAVKASVEHSETPKSEAFTRETLQLPTASSASCDRSRMSSEDGLSVASGPGSQISRDSILDSAPRDTGPRLIDGRSQSEDLFGAKGSPVSSRRRQSAVPNQKLAQLFDDAPIAPAVQLSQQPSLEIATPANLIHSPRSSHTLAVPGATSRRNQEVIQTNANVLWEEEKQHLVHKYEQKLKHLKELHEDEVTRGKDEKEALTKHYKSLIEIMEKDRVEAIARYDKSSQDMELRHQQALDSLRILQEKNFQEAKAEFEKKVDFVKKQKDMEVDAIKSASSHLQSVNVVVEQVESQAKLINEISNNLGNKSSSTLDAREFQIRAKENEIRIQEDRLERQLSDTERERKKIQELIAKMEMHMRETATSLENDKFTLIQDQARLAAEKKNVQMMQQEQLDKVSQEKSWLDKAKADFEREQKENRALLYEERRLIGIERAKLDASVKSYSEREKQESVKNVQAEAEISGSLRAIANEHETLAKTSAQLKLDRDNFEKERNLFEQEKKRIEVDRKITDEAKYEMRTRQTQLDHLTSDANKIRDEGLAALSKATAIELEHNHRTGQLKAQLTALRAQEQSLAQERLLLAQEQKNLEAKKGSLICTKCSAPVSAAELNPVPQAIILTPQVKASSMDYDHHNMRRASMPGHRDANMATTPMVNDSGFNTPADFTSQINTVQSVDLLKQMLQMDFDLENLRHSALSEDRYLMEEEEYLHSLRASRSDDC